MVRTMGVEEELLLVDPDSGRLRSVATQAMKDQVAAAAPGDDAEPRIQHELFREQLEVATRPCHTLSELGEELRLGRARASAAAAAAGAAVAASGTPAPRLDPELTAKSRYSRMAHRYGVIARRTIVCGTHVHVAV